MSSGGVELGRPIRDLGVLAPRFRDAVQNALAACNARGLDAMVYETYRTQELQAAYYARGRTIIPPIETVTNAPSNLYSWHGFGLAVDVISASKGWSVDGRWFEEAARCFRAHGCRWGGEWKQPDLPHFQWGVCKPSPSDQARVMLARGGVGAVWEAVRVIR
jgi:peptidoglycan L-alanyl-D-glutamate endopeptidase CwlK